jgi:hypothetical protein
MCLWSGVKSFKYAHVNNKNQNILEHLPMTCGNANTTADDIMITTDHILLLIGVKFTFTQTCWNLVFWNFLTLYKCMSFTYTKLLMTGQTCWAKILATFNTKSLGFHKPSFLRTRRTIVIISFLGRPNVSTRRHFVFNIISILWHATVDYIHSDSQASFIW